MEPEEAVEDIDPRRSSVFAFLGVGVTRVVADCARANAFLPVLPVEAGGTTYPFAYMIHENIDPVLVNIPALEQNMSYSTIAGLDKLPLALKLMEYLPVYFFLGVEVWKAKVWGPKNLH